MSGEGCRSLPGAPNQEFELKRRVEELTIDAEARGESAGASNGLMAERGMSQNSHDSFAATLRRSQFGQILMSAIESFGCAPLQV